MGAPPSPGRTLIRYSSACDDQLPQVGSGDENERSKLTSEIGDTGNLQILSDCRRNVRVLKQLIDQQNCCIAGTKWLHQQRTCQRRTGVIET
jgi:hypothetical protein